MCGRYTLINLSYLTQLFPWITDPPIAVARYNIAPGTPILAVANDKPDMYDFFLWGLIPSWAKDATIANKLINARCETLAGKNSFKKAYQRRRCLIPADGFYEWKKSTDGKTKQPMYIHMKDNKPFALAGLWETWGDDKGNEMRSATIITTRPNKLMATMHDRMPVILQPKDFDRWLAKVDMAPAELDCLLKPFPDASMEAHPVAKTVNNPRNEGPGLVALVRADSPTLFG